MRDLTINRLIILMGLIQIYAWATTYYLPATLVQIVADELNATHMEIIGGFSWALLVGGLCAPRIGKWIESDGGRYPLVLGSLLSGFGLAVLSTAHGLFVWYLGWTILGLGMALGLFNCIFSALGRTFGLDAKNIIVKITLISGFATFLWPITSYMIREHGWRSTLIVYTIPHIFIFAPAYYFYFPKSVPGLNKISTPPKLQGKANFLLYLLAGFAILRTLVGSAVSVHVLTIFQGLGLPLSTAALFAAFIGPSQVVGRLIELLFGHKFDPVNSGIFWAAILPISILLLLLIGSPATAVFAITYGMSNGMSTITMSVLPMVLFDIKKYPSLMGKLALPTLLLQAASPILAAPIIDSLPVNYAFGLAGIISSVALGCLVLLRQFTIRKPVDRLPVESVEKPT